MPADSNYFRNEKMNPLQPYLIDVVSNLIEAADKDGSHALARAFEAIKRNISFQSNRYYNSSQPLQLWEFEKIVEDSLSVFNGSEILKKETRKYTVFIFNNAMENYWYWSSNG